MPVSAYARCAAADQDGFQAGQHDRRSTTAIQAICTKSANDVGGGGGRVSRRQRGGTFAAHDDGEGPTARHASARCSATPPACPTPASTPRRATWRCSAWRCASASRQYFAYFSATNFTYPRPDGARPQRHARRASRASTASRPAISAPPATTSSPRSARQARKLVVVVMGGDTRASRNANMVED